MVLWRSASSIVLQNGQFVILPLSCFMCSKMQILQKVCPPLYLELKEYKYKCKNICLGVYVFTFGKSVGESEKALAEGTCDESV